MRTPPFPTPDELAADAQLLAVRLLSELKDDIEAPAASGADQLEAWFEALFAAGVARAFAHGLLVRTNQVRGRATCRVCGCWELGACEGGCWWVEVDLCSTCAPGRPIEIVSTPPAALGCDHG